MQQWVRDMMQVLAPESVKTNFYWFSQICRWAVIDGLISQSPAANVQLPRRHRPLVVPPTTGDVHAIVSALPERVRGVAVLAAGTGLRHGECFGLGIDHLDFDEKTVTVERQLLTPNSGQAYLGPPKSKAAYRKVPLPRAIEQALITHLDRWPPGPDGLVFTNSNGKPITRHRIGEIWRSARKRAALPDTFRFHHLRHFYVSMLVRYGESVATVKARLGHARATDTLEIYGHLWPDSDERTIAAVDSVLGDLDPWEIGNRTATADESSHARVRRQAADVRAYLQALEILGSPGERAGKRDDFVPAGVKARFVRSAREYGHRKNLSYPAWRDVGVPVETLRRAGIRA